MLILSKSCFPFQYRPCDSRNLNLSPLCMLNGGTLPRYWMEEVTWMRTTFCLFHRWRRPTPHQATQTHPIYRHCQAQWGESTRTTCSFQSQRWDLKDGMLMMFSDQGEFYNSWEEDIAVVNIFFGKETVMGRKYLFVMITSLLVGRPTRWSLLSIPASIFISQPR